MWWGFVRAELGMLRRMHPIPGSWLWQLADLAHCTK